MNGLGRTAAGALATLALAACGGSSGAGAPADGGSPTPRPPPIAVTLYPTATSVTVGQTAGFDATVTGTTQVATTWTVEPAGCGAVASTGAHTATFTAPPGPGTCVVRARSAAAQGKSAAATVNVIPQTSGGVCGAAAGQLFPPAAPWNVAVDSAFLDDASTTIISYLQANHTAAQRFQITFDFNVLYVATTADRRAFTKTGDFYTPDCDPAPVPVPPGGRLESEADYHCASDGDCHLTVVDSASCRLWEMWRADIPTGAWDGTPFNGGCLAIWNLSAAPPAAGRGEGCTSADAAGLPIIPLVFTADEVAAGEIKHALRFVLPNGLIRRYVYVRPGTHSTGATGGPAAAPPYAARLRLKAAKDVSGFGPGAKVVAAALKKYGMFLADGGNVTFTAATDALTAHKWSDAGVLLGPSSLKSGASALSWTDFEVVQMGAAYDWSLVPDCSRTPISD